MRLYTGATLFVASVLVAISRLLPSQRTIIPHLTGTCMGPWGSVQRPDGELRTIERSFQHVWYFG